MSITRMNWAGFFGELKRGNVRKVEFATTPGSRRWLTFHDDNALALWAAPDAP